MGSLGQIRPTTRLPGTGGRVGFGAVLGSATAVRSVTLSSWKTSPKTLGEVSVSGGAVGKRPTDCW